MGLRTMKFLKRPPSSRVWLYRNTLFTILFAVSAVQSQAQAPYTIASQNGSTSLQATFSGPNSGLSDWVLQPSGPNPVSQLNQEWFYYSLGSGPVYSIDQIASPTSINNHNFGGAPFLQATYVNSDLSVTVKFAPGNLSTANGQSTLTDTLTIANPSAFSETIHFYQYTHLTLGGVAGGQNVQFSNNGSGVNYQVNQNVPGGGGYQGQLIGGSPSPGEVQAGVNTQFGLVNGNASPTLDNVTLAAGPGDVSYAYEWDVTLAPTGQSGSSFIISELQTVPEPSSLALMASGMLGLAFLCWRRRVDSVIAVPAAQV